MCDDRLAVGHRLDREHAVPEIVHLVDDDVRTLETLHCFVVRHPVHDVEIHGQLGARLDHVARPLFLEVRGRVNDERSLTLHRDNRLVRRKGRVFIINKTQKRFKARQG